MQEYFRINIIEAISDFAHHVPHPSVEIITAVMKQIEEFAHQSAELSTRDISPGECLIESGRHELA
jgi:hypothetical protein